MSAWNPTVSGSPTRSRRSTIARQECMPPCWASRPRPRVAVVLGDRAGLPEGLGDRLLAPFGIFRPVTRPAGGVDPHDAVLADAEVAERLRDPAAFLTCSRNLARPSPGSIAEPPPVGGQTGATTEPIISPRAPALSASALISSSVASMLTCGRNRKRSNPSNLTPSTSAAAVRSSIVSRSIGGSGAFPLPTTQARRRYAVSGTCSCDCRSCRESPGERFEHGDGVDCRTLRIKD